MDVEVIYFDDCPNYADARALVERVAGELGVHADVRLVRVETPDDAQRLHFRGSPTIRIDGRDVDPNPPSGAYALACRVYATQSGPKGLPEERWVRDALSRPANTP